MSSVRRKPLFRSIVQVLTIYGGLEVFGFFAIAEVFGFPAGTTVFFLLSQAVFHIGLALFLLLASDFFYIEKTGERLSRVNIANKVTLLRVSMLPSVLFLILVARDYQVAPILAPVLAVTFLTDLIDGRLSRAKNQVTLIGKILDSVSDYSLLIVIAVAYRVFEILPAWLFGIIFFRFLFQAIGMLCVLIVRKKVEPKPTIFGKIAVATTMLLFAAEATKLVVPPSFHPFFDIIEYAAGGIVAISVIDKGLFFVREIKRGRSIEQINPPNG